MYKCGIDENGHSFEIVNGKNQSDLFSALTIEEQILARRWVEKVCKPAVALNRYHTSYGLKHILENCIGIYMTNNQFKDLMLMCSFKPKYEQELNWQFFIQEGPFTKLSKWNRNQRKYKYPRGSDKAKAIEEFFSLNL